MAQIELKIVSRSGRDLGAFTLPAGATLADLKAAFAAKHRKWGPERQYFTREVAAGAAGERLALSGTKSQQPLTALGVNSGDTLTFKDLGMQVGYRTVFYVEYAGPLLIHAAFYFLQPLFYGQRFEHSAVQQIAFACVAFHYLKREFESAFVHQFSNDTMPWTNIFKNSFHYGLLGGGFIAYFLYHPHYTAPFPDTPGMPLGLNAVVLACVAVFVICELGNLSAHLTLKNLRPPGTKRRAIPRGGLFELVACPNYFFETGAWLAFCIFTQTLTGYFFLVVSTGQMAIWAAKKHKQYKLDFGDEYKNLRRKKMFPFLW